MKRNSRVVSLDMISFSKERIKLIDCQRKLLCFPLSENTIIVIYLEESIKIYNEFLSFFSKNHVELFILMHKHIKNFSTVFKRLKKHLKSLMDEKINTDKNKLEFLLGITSCKLKIYSIKLI